MWQNIKFAIGVATIVGSFVYAQWVMNKTACYCAMDEWHEMDRLRKMVDQKKEETL